MISQLKLKHIAMAAVGAGLLLALNGCEQTSEIPSVIGPIPVDKLDNYGGYKPISFEATGRFRVEKLDDQWWLVTPEGHAFYSHAVQGVNSAGTGTAKREHPYLDNILRKYGSEEVWADETLKLLRSAGQNTLGDFSETDLFFGKRFPYVDGIMFDHMAPKIANAPKGFRGAALDFFDPVFTQRVNKAAVKAQNCADDPYCIGVFTGDEYPWATSFLQPIPMFDAYQMLPAGAPGKQALQAFLAYRYKGDIKDFNKVWQTEFSDFNEIQSLHVSRPQPVERPGYYKGALGGEFDIGAPKSLDNPRSNSRDDFDYWINAPKAQNEDRFAFRGYVAKQFYQTVDNALDKVSPNMLNLCARFLTQVATEEVVKVAAEHCDVLSINAFEIPKRTIKGLPLLGVSGMYDIWADWTQAWVPNPRKIDDEDFLFYDVKKLQSTVDKPILLSSFSYRAKVKGLNSFPPKQIFEVLPNQKARADRYENYMAKAYQLPSVVGAHWFMYSDQPAEGRFDGENSNFGLVSITDEPYRPLVERMAKVTAESYLAKGAGSD